MKKNILRSLLATIAVAAIAIAVAIGFASIAPQPVFASVGNNFSFRLKVSPGAETCLPNAYGTVTVNDLLSVQNMHVEVFNLPGNEEFALFVIQVPNSPFGLSWYQGDIETNSSGHGVIDVTGIFSGDTFIVAPGVAPAPNLFPGIDATTNPATAPVQINHLGVWFGTPANAAAAGCADTETPFESNHQAGIQVLNTGSYPDTHGPLQKVP